MSFSDDIQNALQMLKQEEKKIFAPVAGLGIAPNAALMSKDLTIESRTVLEPFLPELRFSVPQQWPYKADMTTQELQGLMMINSFQYRTFTRVPGILSLLYLEDD